MIFCKNNIIKYCSAFLFFIFSAVGFCQGFISEASAVNAGASVTCLDEAIRFFNEGDFKQAFFHAQLGSSYDLSIADFPYLEALCGKNIGIPAEDCLNRTEVSLGDGMKWLRFDEDSAKLLAAELNLKMMNYREALSLTNSLRFQNADSDFINAAAFYGLENIAEAERLISESLDKYGFEPRFIKLFFMQERGRKLNSFGKNLSKKILSVLYLRRNNYSGLLPLACSFEPNAAVNVHNLKIHRVMHLPFSKTHDIKDVFFYADAILAALHYGVISDETAIEEFFNLKAYVKEPLSEKDILVPVVFKTQLADLCSMVGTPLMRSRIKEILINYAGAVTEDANKDEILESIIFYKNGRPHTAVFDAAQKGYPQLTIECSFGIPKIINGKQNSYKVFFEEYPFVASFEKENSVYTMRPLSLKWQPVTLEELNLMLFSKKEKASAFFVLTMKPGVYGLTEQSLVYSSHYHEISNDGKDETEKTFFNKGIPDFSEKRVNGILASVINFKNGLPAREKVDLNLDGYFELIKNFDKNGILNSISLDLNQDNIFEYNEFYSKDGSVRKIWSSAGKTEILYTEYPSGNSSTEWIHPVSKEKVSVKYSSGIPYTLSIGEKSVQILKEVNSSIYWLKKMPAVAEKVSLEILKNFDRPNQSLFSAMLETNDGSVFAVKSGGVIFAEFIDE